MYLRKQILQTVVNIIVKKYQAQAPIVLELRLEQLKKSKKSSLTYP